MKLSYQRHPLLEDYFALAPCNVTWREKVCSRILIWKSRLKKHSLMVWLPLDELVIVFNNLDQSQMLFAFRQWFRDHVLFGFFENRAQTFFHTFERNLLAAKFVHCKFSCTLIQSSTSCIQCLFWSIPMLSCLLQWWSPDVMWKKNRPTGKDKK